eukprot:Gregarina_sp_Poly_1__7518@NODE_419_length_8686_cov_338_596705_g341_i0_p2_GENE_NODE_419_length_8686_cov_338_596705_g341_i0NODE_419_length_8686_cov_338_596705_g341_i0_p2_ORF_typecomplete_len547_score61_02IIGP/PF05049_13/6_6e05IIGP/PF05049_13/4_4e22FeoB_N/PF02421_18/6_2e06RsgA_GTPase/PF03193_16/0_097RsgA_GTPase/PF03193_16/54AIG1/PF04548_16/0_0039MMR_HSR1/PF01926_23/0_0082Dynamin_N/PF00350_23/0_11Roc/PF08477_13/0_058_NODE_419_length_8686_cov_338_596705_g341_i016013241
MVVSDSGPAVYGHSQSVELNQNGDLFSPPRHPSFSVAKIKPIVRELFDLHRPIHLAVESLREILSRAPGTHLHVTEKFCDECDVDYKVLLCQRLAKPAAYNICIIGESSLKHELMNLIKSRRKRRFLSHHLFVEFHETSKCDENVSVVKYIYNNHLYEMTLVIQLTSRPLTTTDITFKRACDRFQIPLAFVNLHDDVNEPAVDSQNPDQTLFSKIQQLKQFFLYLADDYIQLYLVHLPTIKRAIDDPDIAPTLEESAFLMWVAHHCGEVLLSNLKRPPSVPNILAAESTANDFVVTFVGEQFVGRSTIVNALLGIPMMNLDDDHRPTTTVRERKFRHPWHSSLILRDVPSRDIDGHDTNVLQYIQRCELDQSTVVIIVFTGNCRETDLLLAQHLREMKIAVVLVRTKSDLLLEDMLRQNDTISRSEASRRLLGHLRHKTSKHLSFLNMQHLPCYILSGYYLSQLLSGELKSAPFDEIRFVEDLVRPIACFRPTNASRTSKIAGLLKRKSAAVPSTAVGVFGVTRSTGMSPRNHGSRQWYTDLITWP